MTVSNKKLIKTGIIGGTLAAIGCFTPALVVLFGIAGISGLMGWWLDYLVLYPALAFFVGLTIYAIYRYRKTAGAARHATAESGAE